MSACARALNAALGLVLAAGAFAAEPAAPAAIPAETFFGLPELERPLLSPSGDALAVLVRGRSGHRQLAVLDTADLHHMRLVASVVDADVGDAAWVNDSRLVFHTAEEGESARERRGGALFAVDRDGGNQRLLIGQNPSGIAPSDHHLGFDNALLRTLRDGSNDIIVLHRGFHVDGVGQHSHAEVTYTVPMRQDTRTGLATQLVAPPVPDNFRRWLVDERGQLLGALALHDGRSTLLTREASTGAFKPLTEFAAYGVSTGAYAISEIGADGRIYVTQDNAAGEAVLRRLDMRTGQPEADPVLTVHGFDYAGALVNDRSQHRVVGAHYLADAGGTAWFDPALQKLQDAVDARLPGRVNTIDIASCGCAKRVLVTSFSDRQPAEFLLYDRTSETLIPLGGLLPAIDPKLMARTTFERIKARDGHDLPVYVTRPQGKGPWPAVVLVHGGPNMRGWEWEWDAESQFLASRGYAVVKPEFRGSAGYGTPLLRSGFKQWGLASQDDIADATRWAVAQGIADGNRLCIAGGSYGGYATLMGLVRYGDLHRCGVAWAAVTDIDLMYDLWWSDTSDDWKGYGMPTTVGDRVKDAAQFAATSPLLLAEKIRRPLLLAHGDIDRRVPIEHATRLRDALEASHAPLTWVEYRDEAHGWYKPETRVDFYTRMAAFLAANIGPDAAPAEK